MNKAYRAIAGLGASIALAAAGAMPAEAQASSWGVVFSTHYGVAADFSGYTTVIALTSDDAWAFGANDLSGGDGTSPQQPVAVQWNGTAWQASALPAGVPFGITAASAISASDIWAVTQFGGYVLHWDGSSWSVATQLPGSTLDSGQVTDITAFSDSNVWVYGGGGFTSGLSTWHYDGSTWTQQTDSSAGISFASAVSATDIWAVGTDGSAPQNAIVNYNGTAWQPVTSSALTGLSFGHILAVSATDVWVAASPAGTASTFLMHFDGSSWSQVSLPLTINIVDLAPDGQGGIWVTGQDSSGNTLMAEMSAAGTWSNTQIGSSGAGADSLANVPGTTAMWAAGLVQTTPNGSNATIWGDGIGVPIGQAPTITSADQVTFAAGAAGSFTVTATGSPAPTFSESGALPAGVTFSAAGVLSGTPAAGTGGSYPIQITATNSAGTATQSFTLTVTGPPGAAVGVEGTDGQLWVQAAQLPAGWHPLGGVIVGPPAVVAPPNPGGPTIAQPLFIAAGSTRELFVRSLTAGWQPLGFGASAAYCLSPPGAVIVGGTLTVACRGEDNALWVNSMTLPASGLPQFTSPWTSLGGVLSAGPAVAQIGGTITFFARGTTGQVFTRTAADGYALSPWTCIGHLAAATDTSTGITTFACQGTDHALWEATNPGTGWTSAQSLGGVLIDGPGIAAGGGTTEFFVEGTNGAVFERTVASSYTSLGGVVIGGVGATTLG